MQSCGQDASDAVVFQLCKTWSEEGKLMEEGEAEEFILPPLQYLLSCSYRCPFVPANHLAAPLTTKVQSQDHFWAIESHIAAM